MTLIIILVAAYLTAGFFMAMSFNDFCNKGRNYKPLRHYQVYLFNVFWIVIIPVALIGFVLKFDEPKR